MRLLCDGLPPDVYVGVVSAFMWMCCAACRRLCDEDDRLMRCERHSQG